jgi:hypothetical protein
MMGKHTTARVAAISKICDIVAQMYGHSLKCNNTFIHSDKMLKGKRREKELNQFAEKSVRLAPQESSKIDRAEDTSAFLCMIHSFICLKEFI